MAVLAASVGLLARQSGRRHRLRELVELGVLALELLERAPERAMAGRVALVARLEPDRAATGSSATPDSPAEWCRCCRKDRCRGVVAGA